MASNILKFQTSISLVIQILTLTEIKSMGCLLQVIWWILDQQPSLGDHESNQFLLILQLKPNTLQQLKPQNKSFGFEKFLKTCRRNKWLQRLSLLTILLQSNWPKILNSMIEPNISTPNIIWFDIMLRPKPFISIIVPLQSKLQTSLLKLWVERNLKNLEWCLGWQMSLRIKGGMLTVTTVNPKGHLSSQASF